MESLEIVHIHTQDTTLSGGTQGDEISIQAWVGWQQRAAKNCELVVQEKLLNYVRATKQKTENQSAAQTKVGLEIVGDLGLACVQSYCCASRWGSTAHSTCCCLYCFLALIHGGLSMQERMCKRMVVVVMRLKLMGCWTS